MNLVKLAMRTLLGRRLPTTAGTLTMPGIEAPITIRRDQFGIPHIDATCDADAWFGLGFCQGQDRTFQIEATRRVLRGTLSALIGKDGLPIDRLSRRIGFHRVAAATLQHLDAEDRLAAEAFAAGVTAGATIGRRTRPHELALLRDHPQPYTAADAAGIVTLQSFALASNWDIELARLKVLTSDGAEALAMIDPRPADWLPATDPPGVPAGPAVDRLISDLNTYREAMGSGGGSNNWAIAGRKTASGRPILANDPHLAPMLPALWYLAHLRTPDWAMAGATAVGAPGMAAGHNGFAAWGVTAGLVDNTDLYVEEVGPDGRSVRRGDAFVPCEVLHEVVEVRGGAPVIEDVLITDRGPIVGPALAGEVGAVSMQATWLRPAKVKGLLALHRVDGFASFREAFRNWPVVPLNMAYADADGTIGWQLVGEGPVRRRGFGTVPLPAWDPGTGWEDEGVPYDQMPHAENPDSGWIATANNRPMAEGEGPFLGADWLDGYRVARIGEELQRHDSWDVFTVLQLQMDQLSLPWREVKDVVLAAIEGEPASLLARWDGVLSARSPAAALFTLFLLEVDRRLLKRHAPKSLQWALGEGFTPLVPHSLYALRRTGHLVWLLRDQPEGVIEGTWTDEIATAMTAVHARLGETFGTDPAGWRWGKVRPLTLRHPLGSRKPLDRVFNLGPFPWGGDANTVSQASPSPVDPVGGATVAIASMRLAIDVGEWENSRFVLAGGQSGNPFSRHYDDLLRLWRAGDAVPIPWEERSVQLATRATLTLRPV